MKRALTLLPLLMLTIISAHADQPAAQDGSGAARTDAANRQTSATSPPEQESPLVQAARRARAGRKTSGVVITNETVTKSSGHITTTSKQHPVVVPQPEMRPLEAATLKAKSEATQKAQVRTIGEEKARRAAEEQTMRRARAAAAAEEGYFEDPDEDPARSEHEANKAREEAAAQEAAKNGQKPPLD